MYKHNYAKMQGLYLPGTRPVVHPLGSGVCGSTGAIASRVSHSEVLSRSITLKYRAIIPYNDKMKIYITCRGTIEGVDIPLHLS